MTYTKNLETGRIELHFDKAAYLALPADVKQQVKSYFRFSRRDGCWASKATANTYWPEQIAKRAGLTYDGETGEALSFAEQVEAKQERAEARAERHEEKAAKRRKEAEHYRDRSDKIADRFWGGQPILVGHHSEKRARRDQKRIHDDMRRSLDLEKTARHHERRAEAAHRTAEGSDYDRPDFLARRIEETEKQLRDIARGKERNEQNTEPGYSYAKGRDLTPEEHEANREAWADELDEREAAALDKLAYLKERLEAAGGIKYDQDGIKAQAAEAKQTGEALEINYRGTWYPYKRANKKTVTVSGWLGVHSMEWKVPYPEIKGTRTAPPENHEPPPCAAVISKSDYAKIPAFLKGRISKRGDGTRTASVQVRDGLRQLDIVADDSDRLATEPRYQDREIHQPAEPSLF